MLPFYSRSGYRFIPACAGNSAAAPSCRVSGTVHPRVCGEQIADKKNLTDLAGSSPRVRGTVSIENKIAQLIRFIPACAGNSNRLPAPIHLLAVHPRVCGEQFVSVVLFDLLPGSSPRVRGTVFQDVNQGMSQRFIPACAGNSLQPFASSARTSVHPRVCGEQLLTHPNRPQNVGSSPRVRGTVSAIAFDVP